MPGLRLLPNAPAQTTVPGTITAGATSIVCASTANLPVPAANQQFTFLILDAGNVAWNPSTPLATPFEYVWCTTNTVGSNTLSGLTRGVAGAPGRPLSPRPPRAHPPPAPHLPAALLGAPPPPPVLFPAPPPPAGHHSPPP